MAASPSAAWERGSISRNGRRKGWVCVVRALEPAQEVARKVRALYYLRENLAKGKTGQVMFRMQKFRDISSQKNHNKKWNPLLS